MVTAANGSQGNLSFRGVLVGQSIDFDLFQPAKQLIIHLAHDITEQKRQDELVRQVLALSKSFVALARERGERHRSNRCQPKRFRF